MCAILIATMAFLSVSSFARKSLTSYESVQQVLASLSGLLPPELHSSDLAAQRKAWPDWISRHDQDIRSRLLRGDEDTMANWLLLGTSFTREPRALLDVSATSGDLPQLISRRTRDLMSALAGADANERIDFTRRLILSQGYGLDTGEERARLDRHLTAVVDRVIAERQQYSLRLDAALQTGDAAEELTGESRLFRDRGLSLDTSVFPAFAIERALKAMKDQKLLPPNSIRRIAVIGPGLDFADKNTGYDFYPVQTLQPFTSIDSLVRLGLAEGPDQVELTTLDISARVNGHIADLRERARTGASYLLRLPMDLGSPATPELIRYWRSIGDRIGSESPVPKPPSISDKLELRGVAVRPQVVERITPVDFNISTERWEGAPFDLVIATNVLVYYDRLDQSLAFAAIEAMLRPGGFFLTNNAVVELPISRLRSVGVTAVPYSTGERPSVEYVFWYRRNER